MTAILLTYETNDENKTPILVELFYDKHDLFCVTVIIGDSEKVMPIYTIKYSTDLLPALKNYKRQKRKYTINGIRRCETISSLYDECLKAAK